MADIDERTQKNYSSWAKHMVEYRNTLVQVGFTEAEAFSLVKDLHTRILESGIKPVWMKDMN